MTWNNPNNDESTSEKSESASNKQTKEISWGNLLLRIFSGFLLYAILSHIYFPINTGGINLSSSGEVFLVLTFGYVAYFCFLAAIPFLVAFGIARIPKENRRKPLQPYLNNALIATLIVAGISIYGGYNGAKHYNAGVDESNTGKDAASKKAKVVAAITKQDGMKMSESDLTQETLNNIESWLVETMLEKGRNYYAEQGYDPKNYKPKITPSSVYMDVKNKKLAVIKINSDNMVRSVFIIGIQSDELVRVSCLRYSNHDIPVFRGPCGDKIYEAFGLSLRPEFR